MNDGSGLTTEEKMQQEIGGENITMVFILFGETKPVYENFFKQGVTFEWVKNKLAEKMMARYEDLHLYMNDKRIPEPFCLVDLNVQNGQVIMVKIEEGAVYGEEALRKQVL